jgi:hypothetical protein
MWALPFAMGFNTNIVCHDYVNKNIATGLVIKKKGEMKM